MRLPRDYELDLTGAKVLQNPPELLGSPAEQPPAAPAKKKRSSNPLPIAARLELAPAVARPGPWTVTIVGWRPVLLNKLLKAKWTSGLKRADATRLGKELRRAYVPAATTPRRLGLAIVLGPRQQQPDSDAFDKSLRDGLVRCYALKDDNPECLEALPVTFERGPIMATRITLEDLPPKE